MLPVALRQTHTREKSMRTKNHGRAWRPAIGFLQGRLTPSLGRGIQFFPEKPGEWEAEFPKAQAAGLSAAEILVRPQQLKEHPLMSPGGRECIRKLADTYALQIGSVHAFYSREKTYADTLQTITESSHSLGASVILLSFFKERSLSPQYDQTWEDAFRSIEPSAHFARAHGIRFGIEAELPADVLCTFLEKSEMGDVIGVYYDIGNQFACGLPVAEEIRFLGNRIVGVHVKDRLRNDPLRSGNESASVPLGHGCADFTNALRALRDVDYARPLIIQGARTTDGEEVVLHRTYRTYIQRILTDIQKGDQL